MNYFTPYIHIFNQQKEAQRQPERLRTKEKSRTRAHTEVNRLLSAAVVNQQFCHLLLTNAEEALAQGFNGESFALSAEVKAQILSIRADSLASFASQLLALRKQEEQAAHSVEKHRRDAFAARMSNRGPNLHEQGVAPMVAFP